MSLWMSEVSSSVHSSSVQETIVLELVWVQKL